MRCVGLAVALLTSCTPSARPTLAPRAVALSPKLNKAPTTTEAAPPEALALASGTPILVHFFTTYSLPSLADTDLLVTLPAGQLLGVSLDLDGEPAIDAWRDATGAAYAVASWGQWMAASGTERSQQPVVPTTMLIDRRGVIVFEKAGPLSAADIASLKQQLAQ